MTPYEGCRAGDVLRTEYVPWGLGFARWREEEILDVSPAWVRSRELRSGRWLRRPGQHSVRKRVNDGPWRSEEPIVLGPGESMSFVAEIAP